MDVITYNTHVLVVSNRHNNTDVAGPDRNQCDANGV